MSTARHRELDSRSGHIGSYYYYIAPGTVYRNALQGETRVMDDVVGNRDGVNPLDLRITHAYRPLLTGEQVSTLNGTIIRTLDGYPIDYNPFPPDPYELLPGFSAGDVINWGWETLKKSNSSTPHVSAPTFLGETKDFGSIRGLPSFVKEFGDSILRNVAKGYVSWRFAVKPLIGDLVKLYNFRDAISKRRLDLQLLHKQKSSRRTVPLSSTSVVGPEKSLLMSTSTGFTVRGTRQLFAEEKVWGAVRWKLDPDFVFPDDDDERWKAARALTFGITSHELLQTAWELTPWSWLVDYFYGIGNTIAATNNSVPMTWDGNCVMVHSKAYAKWTITQPPPGWCDISGVPVERTERKRRFIVPTGFPPVLPSYRPLVNWRTWSILGSLAAIRSPRVPRGPRYRRRR